jgi:two-component system, OmpR family, phosphate regulon sensor histidine kinase PhoR
MSRGQQTRRLLIGFGSLVGLMAVAVAIPYATVAGQPSAHLGGALAWSAATFGLALLLGVAGYVGLARSAERVRSQEAERNRLQLMARQTVQRIRAHLQVEDVMREARLAIEEELDADAAYLHVVSAGQIGRVHAPDQDWVLPADFITNLPEGAIAILQDLLARRTSMVIQDVRGPEGDWLPPQMREPMRAAGIVSHLLTPVGEGDELLAVIAAERMRPGHPWTQDEVEAVEWIAADLARGLSQARMYEAKNRLVDEFREVDQAKSDFLASISHELRTPLTSIAGFVELLDDQAPGPLNPGQRQMVDAVKRNTVRLRRLIEDLLILSKIESGTFKTALEPVNLADVVTSGAAALQPQARAKGLALTAAADPACIMVNGDPGQLERILLNLLSNAVKFTPAGGKVEVAATVRDTHAVLEVADTGIGIPENDQKDLASRFFRASNAIKRSIPGTGLGLTIVRTIVDNHGGQIDLRSREGEGTTVTIQIPLLVTAEDAARKGQGGTPSGRSEPNGTLPFRNGAAR